MINEEKELVGGLAGSLEGDKAGEVFSSAYVPLEHEQVIYSGWMEKGIFSPESQVTKPGASSYSILMPPPNLTGTLHTGHAFQHFLMDTLARKARLDGLKTLWYPGIDHAGLQLEGVIDKLINQGEFNDFILDKIKHLDNKSCELIREGVLKISSSKKQAKPVELARIIKRDLPGLWMEIAWNKANTWRSHQKEQARVLGDSPDYSRELFTLDPRACDMVNYAFVKYWQDGLIYKDKYLVNWSVGLQTALSDVSEDISYTTRIDPFVTFNYFFENIESLLPLTYSKDKLAEYLKDNPIEVATVRPETVFGDMAIAMHPDVFLDMLDMLGYTSVEGGDIIEDVKVGKLVVNFAMPTLGVSGVKLIVSDRVERDFGTGCLKITPASDIVDYEIWNESYPGASFKHPISKLGTLSEVCGKYSGMLVEEARLQIIFDMAKTRIIPKKPLETGEKPSSLQELKELSELRFEYDGDYNSSMQILKKELASYKIDFDYEHNVTICDRSKTVVEPLISEETFIDVNLRSHATGKSLKEHALETLPKVNYYSPEYHERGHNFVSGLNNWCISRNLIWGHQMPVWYNTSTNPGQIFYSYREYKDSPEIQNKVFVGSSEELVAFCKANGTEDYIRGWVQETKRLDTWFSSSLWPLTTFGYLDYVRGLDTKLATDFKEFYPTSVLTTAKEIFNIWVCRMMMLSGYFTSYLDPKDPLFNTVPFKDLVITPTVLDEKGKKMSKSLGNGLDPVAQIAKFSSDSLRLSILSGMIPDRNMRLGGSIADGLCEKYRNFGNKIWNIVRFLESKDAFNKEVDLAGDISIAGYWLLNEYKQTLEAVESAYSNYELVGAIDALYGFVWDKLASWNLEYLKVNQTDTVLIARVVKDMVMVLSPFMPFEMEVIYSKISKESHSLATTIRDSSDIDRLIDLTTVNQQDVREFNIVRRSIENMRSIKGLFGVGAGSEIKYRSSKECIVENALFIKNMAKCVLDTVTPKDIVDGIVDGAADGAESGFDVDFDSGYYKLNEFIDIKILDQIPDVKKEVERTEKQMESLKKQIESLRATLSNENFVKRAEPEIITSKNKDLRDRELEFDLQKEKMGILVSLTNPSEKN